VHGSGGDLRQRDPDPAKRTSGRKVLRIISEKVIRDFMTRYTDATEALANWRRAVKAATWRNQADVKAQFKDSDLVGDKAVFNIAEIATA
jgi:hypothetical protein